MSTIDLCLNQICAQRKQLLKFAMPPIRYNPVSIYEQFPQYTKHDLDMRRKAEILQYNKGSSKGNKLTKNQKWSQLINGTIPQINIPTDTILYQQDICLNSVQIIVKYPDTYRTEIVIGGYDEITNEPIYVKLGNDEKGQPIYLTNYIIIPGTLPTPCNESFSSPSTASGVPGSAINLYLDKNVPLYKYANNEFNYAIVNPTTISQWNTFTSDNIVFQDSINNTLFNLIIQNTIQNYAYDFAFITPIRLFYNADVLDGLDYGNISLLNNTISIQKVSVVVYYNGEIVTLQTQPIISHDFNSFQFDISMNYNSTNKSISGEQNIGNQELKLLTVSNLYLLTQPGYIYDIQLNFTISSSLNPFYLSNFKPLKMGVVSNVLTFPKIPFTFSGK